MSALRRRLGEDPLIASAYALMLNVLLSSALGVAFWIFAARLLEPAAVGRDAALVSTMIVLSTVCQLNFGATLLRFLPIVKMSPARAVAGAYALTCAVSLLAAVGFVLIAPLLSSSYRFLSQDPLLCAVWVLAVTAWGVFALQDSVLTALRRSSWVAAENAAFGALKIAVLPLLAVAGVGHPVFIAWMAPMIALLVPVNYLIYRRAIPQRALAGDEPSPVERFGRRGLARFMAADYLASIFIQAGTTLVPVLVVGLLGARRGAYFYIPFTMVCTFDMLFGSAGYALTVEGAMAPERLTALVRATLRRFAPLLLAGAVVLIAGAGLVLSPYGGGYVRHGAPLLSVMACASVFRAMITLYGTVVRVQGSAWRGMAIQGLLLASVLGATFALGARGGLHGVALGWLLASALSALPTLPRLWRVLRPPIICPAVSEARLR